MPVIEDPDPKETEIFKKMLLEEPGDWVASYNPEKDGDLNEWVARIREKHANKNDERS